MRHKEFTRNLKREYGKLLTLLQAYALVSSGVRIICSNQSGGKHAARATVIHTQGNGSVRQNVATVFGAKTIQAMVPVDAELEGGVGCRLVGFVSKAASGCGRGAGDRQFFFVNGRPVDLPRFAKTINELYRAFCPNQCPMAVLDFKMPTDAYDVNVTPDKRKVMLHDEDALLRAARAAIETVYEPSRYTYAPWEKARRRPTPRRKSRANPPTPPRGWRTRRDHRRWKRTRARRRAATAAETPRRVKTPRRVET